MTIYATMNPVGSTHPKDLRDNAQNLDYWSLGPLYSYPDRRGVNRLSLAGIEASFAVAQAQRNSDFNAAQAQRSSDFNAAQVQRAADYAASEASRGYENPVPYAAGIALTRVTQLVQYSSELYKAKAGSLPWTTTGVWATDSVKLVPVGDAALRQELAASVNSKRFVATGDDDSGTPYSKFTVSRTHTLGTSPHAFRDETIFDPSLDARAACSYDASLKSIGSRPIDHTIAFQARNEHNGSGVLKDFYGAGSFNISLGPVTNHYGYFIGDKSNGAVGGHYGVYNQPGLYGSAVNAYGFVHVPVLNAGSTLTNSIGLRVESASGSGSLSTEIGFYCKALTKGITRNPIYIEQQTGLNYIGAKTQIDHTLQVGGNARLSVGGATGSDFPAITYNFDPRLNTYIASADASGFQWGSTNFTFRHAPSGSAGATPAFTTLLNIHTANDANKGAVFPGTTNTQNLGIAGSIWKEIFCGNPTINTSDARVKTEMIGLSANELAAAKQMAKEIGSFKFLEAVAEKGDAARVHIGMTVQRAIQVLLDFDLEPMGYSFICYDKWDETVVEHEAITIDHAAVIVEHDAVYEFGSVVDANGQPIRRTVSDAWIEFVAEAWTETVREAWTEVIPAGDSYGFRATELLSFIAAGFESRLSAIESALDII